MKILRGFVQGVVAKGTTEKPWALVGISDVSKNRNGFEETTIVEFMIAGQQYKDGLHNAYRSLQGSEVFAPYTDEIDSFNDKSRIRYNLQGVPMRLQDAAPAAAPKAVV
ncbi:MAG: hypothetical protein ACRD9S_21375 [Pyrinomonadaceae bacterium]